MRPQRRSARTWTHSVSMPFIMTRSHGRTVALVTGFGPFPGVPVNPSWALALAVANRLSESRALGLHIVAAELPTEWQAGADRLASLLAQHTPRIAIHFGVSSRARGFVLETRAVNTRCAAPDACGGLPDSGCIDEAGHAHRTSTFPVALIANRLRRQGLPHAISRDAGTYLCNDALYRSLALAALRHPRTAVGFVHLPDGLQPAGRQLRLQQRQDEARVHAAMRQRPRRPVRLPWSDAVAGGALIVETAAGWLLSGTVPARATPRGGTR